MVLYFSATGNSAYVAKKISAMLQEEDLDLFSRLKENDTTALQSERPFVVVSPTYAWQLPHLLRDWLKRTELKGSKKIYFVLTCGNSIGNAEKGLKKLCGEIGKEYCGCAQIVMPENYIVLFQTPREEEARKIIQKAEPVMRHVAQRIASGDFLQTPNITPLHRLESGMINNMFYRFYIGSKKFRVKINCIHCGKCAAVCVKNNIQMQNGRPQWGNDCIHCMACICQCPVEAIEYGKATKGKVRYHCPVKADATTEK